MMDALARLSIDPDDCLGKQRSSQSDGECYGEDADAIGAYTQALLGCPKTWNTIPREYWPPDWHGKYTEPLVLLKRNLYGHLLAGLFWQRHCQSALFIFGWEQVEGCECLYTRRKDRLFLSVYVDDFKMAGLKLSMRSMWEKIATVLDIDPLETC
jgi:hypothetical protein